MRALSRITAATAFAVAFASPVQVSAYQNVCASLQRAYDNSVMQLNIYCSRQYRNNFRLCYGSPKGQELLKERIRLHREIKLRCR